MPVLESQEPIATEESRKASELGHAIGCTVVFENDSFDMGPVDTEPDANQGDAGAYLDLGASGVFGRKAGRKCLGSEVADESEVPRLRAHISG